MHPKAYVEQTLLFHILPKFLLCLSARFQGLVGQNIVSKTQVDLLYAGKTLTDWGANRKKAVHKVKSLWLSMRFCCLSTIYTIDWSNQGSTKDSRISLQPISNLCGSKSLLLWDYLRFLSKGVFFPRQTLALLLKNVCSFCLSRSHQTKVWATHHDLDDINRCQNDSIYS